MQNFSKEQFLMYVKNKEDSDDYYADAYDHLVLEKKWFYWNWGAAFFSFYWLLYRRMYFEAFVLAVLETFFYFLTVKLNSYFFASFSFIVLIFSQAAIFGLFGLFGTTLYLKCIQKRFEKAKKIPSSSVDERGVYWAIGPAIIADILISGLDILPETNDLLWLLVGFYFIALSLYKYQKARRENIM